MASSKIKTLEELAEIVRRLKAEGKTVVQCHGTFDLMHPGHIKHFEAAKREGDALIVTVTPDMHVKKGIGRPVFSEDLRVESIAALECVDYVTLDKNPAPYEAMGMLKPDIFVKGEDYAGKETVEGHPTWEEKQILDRYGGRMHFTREPVVFSSSAILNEHFSPYPEETQNFLKALRSKYPIEGIAANVDRARSLRVLVVGDTILDVYHYCSLLGRSLKEEILRVKVNESEMFAGGAVAVANTVAGFCGEVGLVTLLGRKDPDKEARHEAFVREKLLPNVTPYVFYRDDAPTVVNERFTHKVFLKKWFGLYQIEEKLLPKELESEIARVMDELVPAYDIVLVTDFGLGFLTEPLIARLAERARFLSVNVQTNSANLGFNYLTKYPRADYATASEPEMQLAFRERHAPLERLVGDAIRQLSARALSVTLGPRGALVSDGESHHVIPVLSQKIVDRIGAGDAYLSVTTPLVYAGLPLDLVGFLGNVAGAIACTIVANRQTIDREMLLRSVRALLK